MVPTLKIKYLIDMAKMARKNAHVSSDNNKVGASIRTIENEIFTGCNIEIKSLGQTICAERIVLYKAISEGFKDIKELAVISDTDKPAPPCGACLQFMIDINKEMKIVIANISGEIKILKAKKILNTSF